MKISISFLFVFLCIAFLSCNDQEVVKELNDDGVLIREIIYQDKNDKSNWNQTRYDFRGNVISTSSYVDSMLDGSRYVYDSSGVKIQEENYVEGEFHGEFKKYYSGSGELKQEGLYKNNEMVGDWKYFYKNGQVKEVVRFENNLENGDFIEYYEDGTLKAEGTYKEGDNEHGELKLYNKEGELKRKMNCKMGLCRTTWRKGDDKKEVLNEE